MTVLASAPRISVRPRERRRWVWLLAAGLVLILAAGTSTAIWCAHRLSAAHTLVDYPTYGATLRQPVGETAYFGSNTWPSNSDGQPDGHAKVVLHVRLVRAVVRENTAAARITVLKCVRKRPGDEGLGQDLNDVRTYCSTLAPFTSGAITIGERADAADIVLAVTPTRPGTVRIAGIEVRYSAGSRRGTQQVGAEIVVRTPR